MPNRFFVGRESLAQLQAVRAEGPVRTLTAGRAVARRRIQGWTQPCQPYWATRKDDPQRAGQGRWIHSILHHAESAAIRIWRWLRRCIQQTQRLLLSPPRLSCPLIQQAGRLEPFVLAGNVFFVRSRRIVPDLIRRTPTWQCVHAQRAKIVRLANKLRLDDEAESHLVERAPAENMRTLSWPQSASDRSVFATRKPASKSRSMIAVRNPRRSAQAAISRVFWRQTIAGFDRIEVLGVDASITSVSCSASCRGAEGSCGKRPRHQRYAFPTCPSPISHSFSGKTDRTGPASVVVSQLRSCGLYSEIPVGKCPTEGLFVLTCSNASAIARDAPRTGARGIAGGRAASERVSAKSAGTMPPRQSSKTTRM